MAKQIWFSCCTCWKLDKCSLGKKRLEGQDRSLNSVKEIGCYDQQGACPQLKLRIAI